MVIPALAEEFSVWFTSSDLSFLCTLCRRDVRGVVSSPGASSAWTRTPAPPTGRRGRTRLSWWSNTTTNSKRRRSALSEINRWRTFFGRRLSNFVRLCYFVGGEGGGLEKRLGQQGLEYCRVAADASSTGRLLQHQFHRKVVAADASSTGRWLQLMPVPQEGGCSWCQFHRKVVAADRIVWKVGMLLVAISGVGNWTC